MSRTCLRVLEPIVAEPVRVEVEVVAVFEGDVFIILEGNSDIAVRVPMFTAAAIGMRRQALAYVDQSPPEFYKWVRLQDAHKDDHDRPIPPPPPPGCCPPGQPMPTGLGESQRRALHAQIQRAVRGKLPLDGNLEIYEALAYMIRRAEGQGMTRRSKDESHEQSTQTTNS